MGSGKNELNHLWERAMRAISAGIYRGHGPLLQVAVTIFVVLAFIAGMARSYRWH
jgi:hypothetical protein